MTETPSVAADVLKRLARIQTAVLSDVLLEMGYGNQALSPSLRPVAGPARFAGPALCVSGHATAEAKRQPGPLPATFEVDRAARPGSVVVIDSHGQRSGSVIGGLMAFSFKRAGVAGVVTDGGVRDADELAQFGLPAVAAFTTPAASKGLWAITAIGVPITLPGQADEPVTIEPGDIVCADADGTIIVPAALAAAVAADAEVLEILERRIMLAIEAGQDREIAFGAHDRFAHIQRRR